MSQSSSAVTSVHANQCTSLANTDHGEREDNITTHWDLLPRHSSSPLPGSVSWLLVMLRNWCQHSRKIIQISNSLQRALCCRSLSLSQLLRPQCGLFVPKTTVSSLFRKNKYARLQTDHDSQGEDRSRFRDELFSVCVKWQHLPDGCPRVASTHFCERMWLWGAKTWDEFTSIRKIKTWINCFKVSHRINRKDLKGLYMLSGMG